MEKPSHDLLKMGIEGQLKKVKFPRLSALALSALLTFLKPVLNLQNSRPIAVSIFPEFYIPLLTELICNILATW